MQWYSLSHVESDSFIVWFHCMVYYCMTLLLYDCGTCKQCDNDVHVYNAVTEHAELNMQNNCIVNLPTLLHISLLV